MKRLAATALFIFLAIPYCTLGQNSSIESAETQRRAEEIADRFIERFERTLDFGITWKAFRMSDPSCTHRANGNLTATDYAKLRLSSSVIEKLYIATMNLYYLKAVYELSLVRIALESDSENPDAPAEIELVEKRSKFFQNDDRKPQTAEEVSELIATFDQLARLYRKYSPKGAMKSAAWRANEKYLGSRSGMDHSGVLNGDPTFCIPEGTNVHIVDRGIFYFYIMEEGNRMKVAGLGID
jgi:hypothetical protein